MKAALQLKINKSGDYVITFHKLIVPVLEHCLLHYHGESPAMQSITKSIYPERAEDQQLLEAQSAEWHDEAKRFIEYILPDIRKNNLVLTRPELEEFIRTVNLVRIQAANTSRVTKDNMEELPAEKIQTISEINLLALLMETLLTKIN
jgi:hypothetical protein